MSLSMARILSVLASNAGATTEVLASNLSEPARKVAPVLGRMARKRLVIQSKMGGGWYSAQQDLFERPAAPVARRRTGAR